MLIRKLIAATMMLLAMCAAMPGRADVLYTVNQLPVGFLASDINNAGQIAGEVKLSSGVTHAALYDAGIVTDLGTLGGDTSAAIAINASGAMTGYAESASGEAHAFLCRAGSMRDIGANVSLGINAGGDVVGQQLSAAGPTAFLYSSGQMKDLGTLGTGNTSVAWDIDDSGNIVGESDIDADLHSPFRPFLYRQGSMRDLGTFAGYEENGAQAINNAGRIAGYSQAKGGALHAFIFEHGKMTDAGTFGGLSLDVGGINEAGVFVGSADTAQDRFGYADLGGALVDLNSLIDASLGWHIDSADGINDLGQIVARGCRDSVCRALRLDLASAVPEPSAGLLLVPGLFTLAWASRRNMRRM